MTSPRIFGSDITPESIFRTRRSLMRSALAAGLAGTGLSGCSKPMPAPSGQALPFTPAPRDPALGKTTDFAAAASYNNFYEFSFSKEEPATLAQKMRIEPWKLEVTGHVSRPRVFDLDDLRKLAPIEERLYRFRCVEGWSMVVPWLGYSLSALLSQVQPLGSAKFVRFISASQPDVMPGMARATLDWPYQEGLRLDEALHPLALLCLGMYGQVLPKQSGAPVRLIVPWKYGFKSAKSIVRIELTEQQPGTSWSQANPREYGFFANVNPSVAHPRWSQESERPLGQLLKRPTLPFNGYAEQVASLYAGMDLARHY